MKKKTALIFSIIIVSISVTAWVGWIISKTDLAGYGTGFIPMAPATSLVFILFGAIFIFLVIDDRNFYFRLLSMTVSSGVIIFLCLIVFYYLDNSLPDPQKFLIIGVPQDQILLSGRMSQVTALSLVLLGFAVITFCTGRKLFLEISLILSLSVSAEGLVLLIGYLYNAPLFYNSPVIPVALPTSICIFLSGLILIVLINDRSVIYRLFSGHSVRARLLRSFLPAVIISSLIAGWLNIVMMPHWHMSNPAPAAAISAVIAAVIAGIVVICISSRIGSSIDMAENLLSESEEQYRNLFSANPHPMWIYRLSDLKFLAVNDAAVFHYGYSRDEFLNMTIKDIRPVEDIPRLEEKIKSTVPGLDLSGTWRHIKKSGEIIHVEITTHVITWNDTKAKLVLAYDVSGKKKAEEMMLKINSELERRVAERTSELEKANSELEAFSYSISHDLRAPLRHISGFIEILRNELGGSVNERISHYVDVISESAVKMGHLIDDLLSFSRTGRAALSRKRIDLNSLIDEVLGDFSEEIKTRRIKVNRNDLPEITGDTSMIRVVFVNLISNSIKFTEQIPEPFIEIGSVPDDTGYIFFIRDNGAGFDMNYKDKLFGVFQRLHSEKEFEGTGIGLAIVKNIVHRHHGRVWAEGKPGEGACFYFFLPSDSQISASG